MNRFIYCARFDLFVSSALGDGAELLEDVLALDCWPAQLQLVKSIKEGILCQYAVPGALDPCKVVLHGPRIDEAAFLEILYLHLIDLGQVSRSDQIRGVKHCSRAILTELREADQGSPAFDASSAHRG